MNLYPGELNKRKKVKKMAFAEKVREAKEKGYPVYYENDLICNICGEPWDSFGIRDGDMTPSEEKKFRKGKGCPCCSENLKIVW